MQHAGFKQHWKDIAVSLLKLGATAYGGPAIMGIMQAELQEKRQWVAKPRFVEGLSLANLVPGATATQLAIFLGYARGGWWGGLLAGLCFVLPGFAIMMALTVAYAALGVTPIARGALYGLGPVVLGIYRSPSTASAGRRWRPRRRCCWPSRRRRPWSRVPSGSAGTLLLAGGAGLWLFHSRKDSARGAHRRHCGSCSSRCPTPCAPSRQDLRRAATDPAAGRRPLRARRVPLHGRRIHLRRRTLR